MALALENARLINDSQRRAARERALAQSTARIGSSVEYQTIMLSAVEELNHLLGDSEIIFQLKK